ncbi:acyltransferase family protein [Bordetella sp. 15P40C-2]|uniref:acyltransferase family protein n=1 Tax=Bordetella sp. 15P40C-2 TaxID=2572246 RepID=UPI0013283FD5|nr:acyltransferase family protein [Bordetella sp. 15P40C-2]MVW71366.1 acyltransferase family protein [Bordetella sp. 15P40C-2]
MSSYSYSPAYRPDIDGLRALAVLAVMLFHAGVAGFAGGYVGVDVFFVITGYLLTASLLSSLYQGDFSFLAFYARRARRVVPILTVVLVGTLVAGFYGLMPDAFSAAGQAAQHAAYFAANFFFWDGANNYWQQVSLATQPLLLTWSVAVAAQFVVLLPCLLVLIFRGCRRSAAHASDTAPPMWVIAGLLAGLLLVSLGVSGIQLSSDPAGAFYLLSSRAWEFLAGGLIASLAGSRLGQPPRWLGDIVSVVGLVCVLWGVLTYDATTPYPAEHALAPVIGTALLLLGGCVPERTLLARALSWRPLVWIGAMSFSLYLWHWPLLVLTRSPVWTVHGWPEIPGWMTLIVTFALSWLTWWAVERPFQGNRGRTRRPILILTGALILTALSLVAGTYAVHAGRSDRQQLPPVLTQLEQDTSVPPGLDCEGKPDLGLIRAGQSGCQLGEPPKPDAVPDYVLMGDSHARMWVSAFDSVSRDLGIHGVAMTYANCVPLRGAVSAVRPECAQITQEAMDYVVRSPIQQVILAGYWIGAAESPAAPTDSNLVSTPLTDFSSSLRDTIRYLQQAGKAVTVILDVPELESDDAPRELALLSVSQQGADVFGPTLAQHRARQAPVIKAIEEVWPKVKPFGIVDPVVDLCAGDHCLAARQGRTWYSSKHQLTDDAALGLKAVFVPLLRSVSAPR